MARVKASLMIHAEKSMFHAENVFLGKFLIQFVETAIYMKLDDLFNELNTDISFDFDNESESAPENESTTTSTSKQTETAKAAETTKQTETANQTGTPKQTETTKPTVPTLPDKVYTASDSNVTSIVRNSYQLFDDEGNSITRYASGAELVITKNIKTIENYALYHNNLGKFTVEKNNPGFTTVDGVLFNKDKTKLIAYPLNKTDKAYKVPGSVTEIADGAFAYSIYLEEIEFGSNLKTIGVDAFRGCRFSEVVIPEGVTTINGCAFTDMKELEKITIPPSVKVIVTDILSGSNPDVVICGRNESLAEYFASQYGYKFVGTAPLGTDPSETDSIGLTTIKLGQTELEAGISKDYLVSIKTRNGEWGIYGSKDYENFLAVYYENNKAKFLYTTDLSTYTGDGTVYADKNDNNKEYAVSIGTLPSFDAATNETLIFELTNAFRAVHGLSPLQWNDKLQAAARSHSEDMETKGFFSHTNPDGLEPWDRITTAGYKWRSCAENIYMYSAGVDAISAMDGWINSPGHRQNLLTTDCDELGVGISGAYATQNFGKK